MEVYFNMIDLIIPAYNAHDTIEETLFSVAMQDKVNKLNVYLVNDCSKKNYQKEVEYFSQFMNIKELTLEKNSGPGIARQHGINNSKSEYIVFLDSDDVFADCFAISNLLYAIKMDNHDVGVTNFAMECANNTFITRKMNSVWLHGKIYKRQFLMDNKIEFNNTYANEDNAFNQLVFLSDAKINYFDRNTYIWRFNPNSITRINDHEYDFKGLEGYVYNLTWAVEEGIKRNFNQNKIAILTFSSLVTIYFYYLQYIDKKEVGNLLIMSKKLRKIQKEYGSFLSLAEKETIMGNEIQNILADEKRKHLVFPQLTFDQFLKKIDTIKLKEYCNWNSKLVRGVKK